MDFLPSFVQEALSYEDEPTGQELRYNASKVRMGIVSAIIPPTSDLSLCKNAYEYDVDLFAMDSHSASMKRYRAVVSDTFASYADKFTFTPRPTTTEISKLALTKGSMVVVLFVNDDTLQPLIIGGWPNPNVPVAKRDEPDKGHHLSFEFNGVQFDIDKDGNVKLVRKGATDEEGKVKEGYTEGSGTTIELSKDGSILLQTGSDSKMTFELNKNSGEVNLISEGDVNINCNGKNLQVAGSVVINEGTHPMVRGDKLVDAISNLTNAISSAIGSLGPGLTAPPLAAAAVGQIAGALVTFQSEAQLQVFSSGNKVD